MHTRSQTRNLHNQQYQAPPPVVEQFNLEEPVENPEPLALMDDTRTMAQLLEALTAGYEDVIVVPEIAVDNFELKATGPLTSIQNKQFFDIDKRISSCPHPDISQKYHFYDKFPNDLVLKENGERKFFNSDKKKQSPTQLSRKSLRKDVVPAVVLMNPTNLPTTTGNVVQPPAYQAPAYQAPAPQIQGVSRKNSKPSVKHNEAMNEEHQTQGQNKQNHLTKSYEDKLSNFTLPIPQPLLRELSQ
ncbi:hypothetical protein Tco_0508733 [Tanacetum coccineum]